MARFFGRRHFEIRTNRAPASSWEPKADLARPHERRRRHGDGRFLPARTRAGRDPPRAPPKPTSSAQQRGVWPGAVPGWPLPWTGQRQPICTHCTAGGAGIERGQDRNDLLRTGDSVFPSARRKARSSRGGHPPRPIPDNPSVPQLEMRRPRPISREHGTARAGPRAGSMRRKRSAAHTFLPS